MNVCRNNIRGKLTLPKSRILRGIGSFDRVFELADRHKGRTVDVRFLFLPDMPAGLKVGFVSGKKTGNAVFRNRNKRLMREAFRLNQHILSDAETKLKQALHIVFISNRGKKTFAQVESDIIAHLKNIAMACSDREASAHEKNSDIPD